MACHFCGCDRLTLAGPFFGGAGRGEDRTPPRWYLRWVWNGLELFNNAIDNPFTLILHVPPFPPYNET